MADLERPVDRNDMRYSDVQPLMHDEQHRRIKARKIVAVLCDFLGRDDLRELSVLDVGSSTGYISDELAAAGGGVVGIDVDRPGVAKAAGLFGGQVRFVNADGARMPFPDGSFDVAVFNQIYEHVPRPDHVVAEIRRVLRPGGVVYMGLTSRLVPIEPHYGLPMLSWLPAGAADRYMRIARRGDSYPERLQTYWRLRHMCRGLHVWDYTETVLRRPDAFSAADAVPGAARLIPSAAVRMLFTLLPGYIWIGVKGNREPAGRSMPRLLWSGVPD
jgi:SAM-dependent methyltransferase